MGWHRVEQGFDAGQNGRGDAGGRDIEASGAIQRVYLRNSGAAMGLAWLPPWTHSKLAASFGSPWPP